MHLWNEQQFRVREIAAQLAGVRCFAHQVQLVVQIFLELSDHQFRLQALAIRPPTFDQSRADLQQGDVMLNGVFDAGAQYLHCHFVPIRQYREMHLRDRCAGDGCLVEASEHLTQRLAISSFQQGDSLSRREGRHLVLQLRQFIGDVGRDQVAAGGK